MGCCKNLRVLLTAVLAAAVLSGCVGQPAEELYALPRQPDEYYELQSAIDRVLVADAAYSGPLTGPNQQAVQLADLDGDDQDEAIVFVKTSGEKPLKAYIFDKTQDGAYENTAVMEGDGSAFDAVEYVQIDGETGLEIILGRRLSDQILQSLGVYTYKDGCLSELMTANYSEYIAADLDSDDRRDVFVLRMDAEARTGVAELYRYRDGLMEREPEVSLSAGARQVKRMVAGFVAHGVPAVFVASAYGEDTIVTDIFVLHAGSFRNISANAEQGVSTQTVRNYHVFASDIDEDGLIELPAPVALPSEAAEGETQWVINWYNLAPDGQQRVKMTTFHHYQSGWFLKIPEKWRGKLTVSRAEEQSAAYGYTFSKWNGRGAVTEEIVTIYAFTGENRLNLAQADGRFLLAEKGETAYAAALGACPWAEALTEEDLHAMFRFIEVDWNSGEI